MVSNAEGPVVPARRGVSTYPPACLSRDRSTTACGARSNRIGVEKTEPASRFPFTTTHLHSASHTDKMSLVVTLRAERETVPSSWNWSCSARSADCAEATDAEAAMGEQWSALAGNSRGRADSLIQQDATPCGYASGVGVTRRPR